MTFGSPKADKSPKLGEYATWSVRLTKPPNDIVTATISSLTQEQVGQIDDLWEDILRATQQPDADWNWAYKLRLAVNDERYEVYGIELEMLCEKSS